AGDLVNNDALVNNDQSSQPADLPANHETPNTDTEEPMRAADTREEDKPENSDDKMNDGLKTDEGESTKEETAINELPQQQNQSQLIANLDSASDANMHSSYQQPNLNYDSTTNKHEYASNNDDSLNNPSNLRSSDAPLGTSQYSGTSNMNDPESN